MNRLTQLAPNSRQKRPLILLSAALVLILTALILIWAVYRPKTESYECTNYAMGTYIQQTVYGAKREEAAKEAAKSIGELENMISWKDSDSDVSGLNQAAGTDWRSINRKTLVLLQTALDVAQKSGGAFDPTILPVSSLWDFGGENQHAPSPQEIQKFLPYIDYQNLRLDQKASTASLKNHYMAIDLDALADGAACDEAVSSYRSSGAEAGVVAAGGSVGVFGTKADGSAWRIAVRDPSTKDAKATAMGEVSLDSGFVSTSGVYEKQFTQSGTVYHRLLNPKTGYPENNGLTSVTVVCDNGALSDALSYACFILGKEKGMKLLNQYHADGIYIESNNQVYVTDDLKSRFTVTNEKYRLMN